MNPWPCRGFQLKSNTQGRGANVITPEAIYYALVGGGVPASDARILTAVAQGESSLRPDAVGDNGHSIGMFQIYIPAHGDKLQAMTGSPNENYWKSWLTDPLNNINAAIAVYNSQGLGAWSVYNNGAYEQYLSDSLPAGAVAQGDGSTISSNDSLYDRFMKWGFKPALTDKLGITTRPNGTGYTTSGSGRGPAGGLYGKAALAALYALVIIIGVIAFFKAFDVSVPAGVPIK